MASTKWHRRGLTSLLTLAGFLIMGLTGIILYITPQGRVAYWTDWTFLGLTKTAWGDIHILSSLLFVAAGAFHLYFNWKPLLNYLRDKVRGGLKLKREIALTLAASILVVVSALYQVPPLNLLLDLNASIKDSWVISPEYEPPFGHAELLSLKVFAKKMNIPLDQALAEFKAQGIRADDPGQSLEKIARNNRTSPMHLYLLIKKYEVQPQAEPEVVYTPQLVEEKFAGTGLGGKTLEEIATQLGLDPGVVLGRLAKKGLKVEAGQGLKAASAKLGLSSPLELLKAALVEDYRP